MSSIDHTPATAADHAADPQISLLETGYTPVILDGRLVAVPLRPTAATEAFVPAIVDGQVAAVPVHNPLTTAVPPQAESATGAQPTGPAQPVADPGLPLAVRQYVLYGSVASLAASGAVWMLGAAVGEVAPHADDLGHVLKWAAILVGLVVLGVCGLLGKLRSVAAGTGAGAGATASGDGASATGTVLALVHRTHQTNIGRQTAGWRGSITNNNG
ncbi:hypothetical protein [Kitasatospora sp. KL5]|uniref:hypothetical protein n=1 Tax=Kitasatospora sp. KL5 TaxID=3425125 RepID=UPI003D6E2709